MREFRSVPIGNLEFMIIASISKFYCHDCKAIRPAPIPFARPKKHYTKRFERYVLILLRGATVQFVADLPGVPWATIRDIEKEYLGKHFANPSLKNVKYIAIDEIATKKGHVYMTVVLDLETGLVLYVGEGRDQNALLPFWKRLRKSRIKIFGVATDMSPAYIAAVREHLPDAFHVHNRFHVMNMFNEAINNIRRGLARKIQDKDEKSQLKGIRYILLKCPENLDSSKGEPERLERALKMNEDLSMIYYLKEELHSFGKKRNSNKPKANSWT